MYKCSKNINPNCEHCGLIEDNLHLFIKCTRISKVWKHYQPLLTKLLRKSHTPIQHILTISVNSTHRHTIKLTLTIIQLILFEIWQSRNNNKYDKILLPQHTIIHKINVELQYIIQTHYKKHELNDTTHQFQELFCINNAIAKIHNNQLNILIT